MNNKHIEWRRKKLKALRDEIESGQLNAMRGLITSETVEDLCEASGYQFRKRLLSPLTTILHMINAAISREGSFQSAWENLGQIGRSGVLAEARKRLPHEVWQRLEKWIIERIHEEDNPKWRGHRMIGVDGTGVSMSDEEELTQYFGHRNVGVHVRGCGEGHFPVARVVTAFNLQTLIHLGHEIGDHKVSERVLFCRFLPRLDKGDVVVFDRLYAGANLYAHYQRGGIEFIGGIHPCLKVDRLKTVKVLSKTDKLVEIPLGSKHRKADPALPSSVIIRLIETEMKVEGRRKRIWITTSLLDADQY
ncbi:MAG: transposase, partial [Candidatus Omnitrophica bacterium]|nr:transposase [Candidatus Omnitrophota bacterium]